MCRLSLCVSFSSYVILFILFFTRVGRHSVMYLNKREELIWVCHFPLVITSKIGRSSMGTKLVCETLEWKCWLLQRFIWSVLTFTMCLMESLVWSWCKRLGYIRSNFGNDSSLPSYQFIMVVDCAIFYFICWLLSGGILEGFLWCKLL